MINHTPQDDYEIMSKLSSVSLYIILGCDIAVLITGYLIAQSAGIMPVERAIV